MHWRVACCCGLRRRRLLVKQGAACVRIGEGGYKGVSRLEGAYMRWDNLGGMAACHLCSGKFLTSPGEGEGCVVCRPCGLC